MCYNCGCHLPDDNMGSDDNITNKTFEGLAKKIGKSIDAIKLEVYDSLEKNEHKPEFKNMFVKASKVWGQSVEEAKENTHELLKEVLRK